MQAALGAGEYEQAEQARLAAYAFLDFGPELKLKAFDNQLATELEGLFWYGAAGNDGLAQLIGERAPVSEVRETRLAARRGPRPCPQDARRGSQRGDGDHQLRLDRLPRGPRGDPDPRRDHGQPARDPAAPAQADPARRADRDSGQHPALGPRADSARLAVSLRREARGGGRADRDRGPAFGLELVLPQGLLDRMDQGTPGARQQAGGRRRSRGRRLGDGARALPARVLERAARGIRDRPLPAGAAAQLGHRRRRSPASRSASP